MDIPWLISVFDGSAPAALCYCWWARPVRTVFAPAAPTSKQAAAGAEGA